MARGHYVEGVLAAELTYPIMPFHHAAGLAGGVQFGAWIALVAAAALLPDLDHPKSMASNALGPLSRFVSWLVIRFAKFVYQLTRGDLDHPGSNGHRGITHTPVAGPVVAVGAYLATPGPWAALVASGLLVGWLTHIAGDSCSNSGVPALWPIKVAGQRWAHHGIPHWMRFKTGSHGAQGGWQEHGEHIVTLLAAVGCVAVGAFYADPHLLATITEAL